MNKVHRIKRNLAKNALRTLKIEIKPPPIPAIFAPPTIRNGLLINFFKNVQIDPKQR